LITMVAGADVEVRAAVVRIQGVTNASMVHRTYSAVAAVEVKLMEDVGGASDPMRKIDKLKSTLTLIQVGQIRRGSRRGTP